MHIQEELRHSNISLNYLVGLDQSLLLSALAQQCIKVVGLGPTIEMAR